MANKAAVAVIGSGMAGVTLARLLIDFCPSVEVTLFEKSRGVGGRMATRYTEAIEHDHGAQFFTVRGKRFKDFLKPFKSAFKVWPAVTTTLSPDRKEYSRMWFEPHYVGTPRMNSLCKRIAKELDVKLNHKVVKIDGVPKRWFLEAENTRFGPFEWIVSTAPAPQTQEIFKEPALHAPYDAIYALMAQTTKRPDFDAAVVRDSPISWVAVTSSKPERSQLNQAGIVAHSQPEWTAKHLELPLEEVKQKLCDAVKKLGIGGLQRESAMLHLWRFAQPRGAETNRFFVDVHKQLAACGDWFIGDTVESAFESAYELFLILRPQFSSEEANGKSV